MGAAACAGQRALTLTPTFAAPAPRRTGRGRRWAAGAALVLAAIGVALLVGEVALRAYLVRGPVSAFSEFGEGWHDDPLLGYRPRPTAGPRAERQGTLVTINSLGYRGAEIAERPPPGVLRVVLIGGSVVFGVGCTDDQTIAANLQAALAARLGRPVEVVNAGVPGYTSTPEALLLEARVLGLRPHAVVVFDGFNEVYRATMPTWGPYHVEYLKRLVRWRPDHALVDALQRLVVGPSTLAYYAAHVQLNRQRPPVLATASPYNDNVVLGNERAVALYEHNLGLMGRLAAAQGVHFYVATQPVLRPGTKPLAREEQVIYDEQVRGLPFERGVETLYPRVEAAAERAGAAGGFPARRFGNVFADLPQAAYQLDNVHLTPRGNAHVAARLADWLAPLLPAAPPGAAQAPGTLAAAR